MEPGTSMTFIIYVKDTKLEMVLLPTTNVDMETYIR